MFYSPPEFQGKSFNCPHCNAYSHMQWSGMAAHARYIHFFAACCSCCSQYSIWLLTKGTITTPVLGKLIYPDVSLLPEPHEDMPETVKIDYQEAASIFSKSPRASAALLRLALHKLVIHLGEKGNNINQDIRNLAARDLLPKAVIKVADTIRLTGNEALHPGVMLEEDIDLVAGKMFDFLNFIVRNAITEQREIEDFYQRTPESKRLAAEALDAKSKVDPS